MAPTQKQKQQQQQYHPGAGGGGGGGSSSSGNGRHRMGLDTGTGSIYSGPLDRLTGTTTSEELSSSYPYYYDGTGTAAPPHHHRRRPCSARVLRCCCAAALSMLCVVAVVTFVTWMAVRPHKPKFFVDYAALTHVSLPAQSNRLSLGLALNISCRNANEHVSVAYAAGAADADADAAAESVLVFEHVVIARTAAAALPAFTQAPKNTTVLMPRMRAVSAALDNGTANDLRAALAEGAVPVALRMTARVRFILGRFRSQHYKMRVSCDDITLSAPPLPTPLPGFRRRMCVVYF